MERTTKLIKEMQNETHDCLVCMEAITHKASIWDCGQCCGLFHLSCIQSWAQSCRNNSKLLELQKLFPKMEISWYWYVPQSAIIVQV